jgi:hypothetical protein
MEKMKVDVAAMTDHEHRSGPLTGFVGRGFEPVRDVFLTNFQRGRDIGAAAAA